MTGATDQTFRVRVTEQDDWAAVADGFAKSSGGEPDAVRAAVAWALRDNPHGASSVSAFDCAGRAIGHLGVAHVPTRVGDARQTFGCYSHCFVDPAYRVGGVHSLLLELDETLREAFDDADRLAATVGLWDEADWWFWRHVRGHEALTTSVDFVRPANATAQAGGERTVRVRRDESTADAIAELTHEGRGECAVVRCGQSIRWRASAPYAKGVVWSVGPTEAIRALAITRDTPTCRQILDLSFADDEDAAAALLHALAEDVRLPVRTTLWTADFFTLMVLQRAGFRVAAGREHYVGVRAVLPRLNQQWLANHWTITPADVGEVPMPRLTVGERIVLPAPAGTTSGRARHGH